MEELERIEKICDNVCRECMRDNHKCDKENGCYWDFLKNYMKNNA